jgi:predicted nuclease of predicted toxin-antitoxin system
LPVRLYFDHNVNQAIVRGLRLGGRDVLAAREDGTHRLPDPDLLDRATALGRVLVSSDIDLAIEARRRQHADVPWGGVWSTCLNPSQSACASSGSNFWPRA